ncbi:hypothetical protein LP316_00320 [Thalassotalea sp. LPB0316]|uniref:hypothetical protein n=1 Tax=Thalassotalea sp. LPB0316 TaxID=2769490 RepID=UPI001868B686|nr:hypothetical protein [Thalassotalea sp. LPB0316]QOL25806.1 hypothetical protein LP316_00320 [Thalassotalea sp. LPB0316]
MTQALLWQNDVAHNDDYAKLCNALYERELATLANSSQLSVQGLQARLKSLPYYIKRTADYMTLCETPMTLDVQNGSWSLKQSAKMSDYASDIDAIKQWYSAKPLTVGLVIPIQTQQGFTLDSIDRIDLANGRYRTNTHGWFYYRDERADTMAEKGWQVIKPSKRALMLACAGHRWVNQQKTQPKRLSLRELLLSCTINWKNLRKPAPPLR